jgi:hypothetical protein
MWPKSYKDYPLDKPLKKSIVEPSKGIIGCEMHDLNGWGNTLHSPKQKKKRGLLAALFSKFLSKE